MIEELTGNPVPHYDPRREFAHSFQELMNYLK